ncbi:MAG: 5-oxoprolinase subunit PxpA [Saprospiraceae bacterium]
MFSIDINCDMGESYGRFQVGNDAAIMPFVTSCNIACGYHGGDPLTIEKTIKLALQHGVQIGAHPSYPDLSGFGRRRMNVQKDELKAMLKYQIGALKSMVESLGGKLAYVKPHGALYNTAANEITEATTIIQAVQSIDSELILLGLAGSVMEKAAQYNDIRFAAEAFADRTYTAEGKLMNRHRPNAVIHDAATAAAQVLSIVKKQEVISNEGTAVPVIAQSVCIHGDNPQAVEILGEIGRVLEVRGVSKRIFK